METDSNPVSSTVPAIGTLVPGAHRFELLHNRGDLFGDTPLLGEVLKVQRAHPAQDAVRLGAVLAGVLTLERVGDVAFGGPVADLIQVGRIDEADYQAFLPST